MSNTNNQIIIDDLYDENIQMSEDDIIEYAEYIGIDPSEEPELMWIARQGVKAPLPKGWKAVHDAQQNELYYFNFETGESIWDHPCDKDYKNLVSDERKILLEKGRDNYKPNIDYRQGSPTKLRSSLKNSDKLLSGTSKSTSTISDVLNGKSNQNKANLRNDFALYDTRDIGNVEFEEENEKIYEEDEESEASWQKKSGSDDSDDFRKPVDFGIDKETSIKLDKLSVLLMYPKDKEANLNLNLNNIESAPTTSRDVLDSPTRNYIRAAIGQKDEELDLRKSTSLADSRKQLESLTEEKSIDLKAAERPRDTQKELKMLQESLDREFDQRRLELLENKENRIKKLKDEIEKDINKINENESKRLLKDQEDKMKKFTDKMEADFLKEQENLKRKHNDALNQLQRDFENEKQLRKQKFSMQLSKFMKSGKSLDELDENEEKREIAIYFEHIEKKYSDKLEDRKKEIQAKYDKKIKDLEEDLRSLYEKESEKKENDIRLLKEKNLRIENYDKQMEKLLSEKVKEYKDKENSEINRIKEDYEIKVKTFKEKYKKLEENEFNYLENEFNKAKEKLHIEYNNKINNLENRIKTDLQNLQKQEDDLRKRQEIILERRQSLELEWQRLNEEEAHLEEKKEVFVNKIAAQNTNIQNVNSESDDLKVKYEIERLRLEKTDLENKVLAMQKLLDKYYSNQESKLFSDGNKKEVVVQMNPITEAEDDADDESEFNDSDKLVAKINEVNNKLNHEYNDDDEDDEDSDQDPNDDNEIKELVKHAKLKLKLKYYNSKKQAQIDLSNRSAGYSNETDLDDSEDDYLNGNSINNNHVDIEYRNNNDFNLTEGKKDLLDNLSKEKDALQIANELLNHYKQTLVKRKLKLDSAQSDLRNDESVMNKLKASSDKVKQQRLIEEKKLILEKEALDLEQLGLNIKTGKRLIKQKKLQLNLLENNIIGNLNHLSDTSTSQEDLLEIDSINNQKDVPNISLPDSILSFKNTSNLTEFMNKLKASQSRGDLADLNIQKMQPILKKLPKLNNRLELTFENMKSTASDSFNLNNNNNKKSTLKDINSIEKKWNKYLNQSDSTEKINFFQNLTNRFPQNNHPLSETSNNLIANWENSPAYHKLTFESGTRLLEDKWNQYFGLEAALSNTLNKNLKKLNSTQPSPNNTSFSQFLSNSLITLPASTQNRLNQHREWIKKFKASGSNPNQL